MHTTKFKSKPTLLLTSSVYVSAPFVKLSDTEERIKLTLESVRQWVNMLDNVYIVLCDGSGYNFSSDVNLIFPDKEIECLFFKNDAKKVKTFGKGYGEGEIIKFALENSVFLNNSDYFIKCTSKLFVCNILEVLKKWNDIFQCEFKFINPKSIQKVNIVYIDTRFYIVSKKFYKNVFYEAYKKVNDFNKYYLEHSFKDCFLASQASIANHQFPIEPLIHGVSGSTGEIYKPITPSNIKLFKLSAKRLIVRLNNYFYK